MDANGHAALSHVLQDATPSVIEQLHAQLQEKDRELAQADRRLAQATARTAAIHLHCCGQVRSHLLDFEERCVEFESWCRRMEETKKWNPHVNVPNAPGETRTWESFWEAMDDVCYYAKYYLGFDYWGHEWFDDMQDREPEFESTTWSEHWPVAD